jgi:hypothetical protein
MYWLKKERIFEVKLMSKLLKVIAMLFIISTVVFVAGCANKSSNTENGSSAVTPAETPVTKVTPTEKPTTEVSLPETNNYTENVTKNIAGNNTPAPQPNITPGPKPSVTISSPAEGSSVSVYETITGKSTDVYGNDSLHLYVLINPVATGNVWWVQPEAQVDSDGTWNVNAQFGRTTEQDKTGQDKGAKYWVTSIVTPDVLPLEETNYPSHISASSKKIQLTRI